MATKWQAVGVPALVERTPSDAQEMSKRKNHGKDGFAKDLTAGKSELCFKLMKAVDIGRNDGGEEPIDQSGLTGSLEQMLEQVDQRWH